MIARYSFDEGIPISEKFNSISNWISPVGDDENMEIIDKRHDGGVDLCIVVARPLLPSAADMDVVARKFRNYCRYVKSENFAAEFGEPSTSRVRIALRCDWEIPLPFIDLINQIAKEEQVPAKTAIFYEVPD